MGGLQPQKRPENGEQTVRDSAPVRVRPVNTTRSAAKPDQKQAEAHTADRRSDGERRSPLRRSKQSSARQESLDPPIIPGPWWFVSLALGLSLLIAMGITWSLPSYEILISISPALAISALSLKLAKFERSEREAPSFFKPLAWATIVAPIGLFAASLVLWNQHAGLGWPWIVAGIITMNTLCFSLLTDRPVQQVSCMLTSWGTIAVLVGSADAIGALILASFTTMLIGHYQIKVNRARLEVQQARAREQNRAEDILRDYEETGQGWFWETDRRGLLTYVSPSIVRVTQRPESKILGRPFTDLFDLGDDNRDGERTLTFHLSARSSFQELGVRAATPGEERWWSINGRPAYDSFHNFVGFRGSGTDLTEKKRSEESVTRLAQYDSLTGLANRFQMQQTLEKILSAPQEQQRECSVFLLDLDRFKHVNDTLGHPAGDALLKQVSQRLERAVGNDGRVGRLGGDEFKVIIAGRTERERLAQLAQQIIHSLSQPYLIEGQRVVIGASIGIAVAPDDGLTSESIIRNSDLALYAAKDGGRGRYHFYSNDLHSAAEERSALEQDLRDAIANGDLQLYYQPVVNAGDDTLSGFEALLRWNHPKQGWLSPARFIPIAEDTGLIAAIGEWAIRTACDDLARWPDHIRCAVNVSALQFSNPQLPSIITNAIARARIDPSRLELEITETVFLNDDEGTDAMFTALKRVGVRLALDDFGTGYSSLGYLKKAPFDKIKIDQSFVRGATEPGSRNGAIITSITSLAKSLGMDTTAEGVETLDELDLVRSLGCSHIQGYIYSKAVSCAEATKFVLAGGRLTARGPRSSRAPRQTMLRKVMLESGGHYYNGTIRNMSVGGAMIEGLWNVPPGTEFNIAFSESVILTARSIWGQDDRMGVKFAKPVDMEKLGAMKPTIHRSAPPIEEEARRSA